MYLLIGLGNPGEKYFATRHNIGFAFVDYLAEKQSAVLKSSKWQASLGKILIARSPVILVKPETFMNLSGTAVARIAHYYQIGPENIIVVHDDLDLQVGRVKLAFDRGPGGHNGIRSMIEHLGTKKFFRVRVGIGRPQSDFSAADFVLSAFGQEERNIIQQTFVKIEHGLELLVGAGEEEAMRFVNS